MSARDQLAQLRTAYESWHETKGASVDEWLALMADEVVFQSLGQGAPGLEFSQRCSSKDEVAEYFSALAKDWTMHYYKVHQLIADGDWIAMLGECRWESKQTGKVVTTAKADFWEFRDGKAVSFTELFDTAAAIAASAP